MLSPQPPQDPKPSKAAHRVLGASNSVSNVDRDDSQPQVQPSTMTLERDAQTFMAVLSGRHKPETLQRVETLIPKSKVTVFASSTFTDTHLERNILLEKILPKVTNMYIFSEYWNIS
jgi:hypothetical protein